MKACIALFLAAIQLSGFAEPPPPTAGEPDRLDYRAGAAAATADIARGVLKYEIVGMPGTGAEQMASVLKATYGIDVVFHGCIAGPRIWRDRGYLDTVVQHLTKRYGYDPVAKLDKERASKASSSP